jgi:hypothetical protein
MQQKRHQVKWFNRAACKEDPWISLTDHFDAIENGNILYGENSFGGNHAQKVLPGHNGANVYIRMNPGK